MSVLGIEKAAISAFCTRESTDLASPHFWITIWGYLASLIPFLKFIPELIALKIKKLWTF